MQPSVRTLRFDRKMVTTSEPRSRFAIWNPCRVQPQVSTQRRARSVTSTAHNADFEANRAALASLLNEGPERAARFYAGIDSRSVTAFAVTNKLEFHLASRADGSPGPASLEPADREVIESYCKEQRARQWQLLDELWYLTDVLESAGIPFILLKGLYFADVFYGGVENRFSWDLDVLVRNSDASRADRVLRRSGYFRRSAVLLSRSLTARFTHAFDYGNVRPRFSVDLHWMLSRHPSFRVDDDAMWASRRPYSLLDRRFDVLSQEYEIVSNALSTFRDIQRGAIRMRAFVDLFKLLDASHQAIDWDRFLEKRRDERVAAVMVNILALTFKLLDCRTRFPGSARVVDEAADLLVPLPAGGAAQFFEPGTAALPNRAWTASIYECSKQRVAAWWLVSLPFRMAVYRSGRRYANFKRAVHKFKARLRGRSLEPAPPVRRSMR